MSMPHRYFLGMVQATIILTTFTMFGPPAYAAQNGRPFWTEKSAFIEGDDLFVVGVASNSKSVEEGRKQAFENGKLELMNFAQVTNLEARGLVIETRVTFEEPHSDGTFTIFRLLTVPTDKLRAIQENLRHQTLAQEQALEKTQQDLQSVQKSLARKQQLLDSQNRQVQETLDSVSRLQETLGQKTTRIEQKQQEVEQLLQQLSEKVKQTEQTQSLPSPVAKTTMKPSSTSPLYRRLKETEAQLDAQEQQLGDIAKRAKERLAHESDISKSYQRKCKYIVRGMTRAEVDEVLGPATRVHGIPISGYSYNFMDKEAQTSVITVGFAFNGLVDSLHGCDGHSFDSYGFGKKK